MNRTESGAISEGAPMSRARIRAEIQYALDGNPSVCPQLELLMLTDEGMFVLRSVLYALGCEVETCLIATNRIETFRVLREVRYLETYNFLGGMMKGLSI